MVVTLLFAFALFCGVIAFIDNRINWAALGVILLAAGLLLGRLQ